MLMQRSSILLSFKQAALGPLLLGAVWLLTAIAAWAEVKLPSLISDGMVLQRGRQVNIWGAADPGERVSISFQDQIATVVTGIDGRWKTQLGPFEGGGPYTLTVKGKNELTVRDVLVGEVWVCAGQSNMEITVKLGLNAAEEIATANDPGLRLFKVPITVAGKPQEAVGGQWVQARPPSAAEFSAVGYFFGRQLRKVLNVPVGLIWSAIGGTGAELWTSHETLKTDPDYQEILDRGKAWLDSTPKVLADYQQEFDRWKIAADQAESEGRPVPPFPNVPREPRTDFWRRPSGLFNGMIAPLLNCRIAGVIWYQGEANVRWPTGEGDVNRPLQYRKLFPAMIADWRRAWGEGDFPFLYAQISYYASGDAQYDLNWTLIQEAQLKSLSVPKTAMVLTVDTEVYPDVHPKNKQEVGYRLALAAQALAYGRDIPYSGPIYDSMSIEGAKIRVRFRHVYGGLAVKSGKDQWGKSAPLVRFQIAGADRNFEIAEAKIDGETLVVSSPKVPNPVAVRYAFPWTPSCNLYNQAGLPASPFRTDDWPMAELQGGIQGYGRLRVVD